MAMKCPFCENEKFDSGTAQGHYRFKFISDKADGLLKYTVFGGEKTMARRCTRCGFVAIFTEGGRKPEKAREKAKRGTIE